MPFGGGLADWTFTLGDTATVGAMTGQAAVVLGGVEVTFWSAETGGEQYTDLLDIDDSPITTVLSSVGTGINDRAVGQIPPFWGPDGVGSMWAQAADGPRARIVAAVATDSSAFEERVDALEASVDVRVGAVEANVAALAHDPALRKWYGALASRYGSVVSVVVMGDSNAEGFGVTSFVRRRWQQVLQAQLRSRLQPSGVAGALVPYISASPRTIFYPGDYGRTGTAGVGESSWGLGQRAAVIPAGESVTLTFTGTRAKLWGTKGPSVGRYSIRLNGGAEVVVDGFRSSSEDHGQVIWDSGALAAGTHTVQVARAASTTLSPGNVYPEGLMAYNGDESAGIRVVDSARFGTKVADFTGLNAYNWFAAFGAVEGKALLIMPWGANDATGGTTPEAFRSELESLITICRGNGFNGSVLLVEMPKRGNATDAIWSAYREQMEAIAAADPDVATFDLRARMPDQGTPEAIALGIYEDEVHYNERGQAWIADQIATAIMPR